ncbi:MAG: FtsX-like permease family protein [Proteobacteria bacterium]|nr:FtsX-like permease family protein [Pseudomonadota bacterium]
MYVYLSVRLALQNIRANASFALLFILSLAVGLSGITLVDGFKNSFESSTKKRSQIIAASDITMSGRRIFSAEELKEAKDILASKLHAYTHRTRMYSMVSKKDVSSSIHLTRLGELIFIENHYPLYGQILLESGHSLNTVIRSLHSATQTPQVFMDKDSAQRLSLSTGDLVTVGDLTFTVGEYIKEDGGVSAISPSLAPKVYISRHYLVQTGLVQKGSSVWNDHLYALKNLSTPKQNNIQLAQLTRSLQQALQSPSISIEDHNELSDDSNFLIRSLSSYLSLVSLVAFFLACMSTCYLFGNYLGRKRKESGTLIHLGLTPLQALIPTIIEILLLSAFATLLTSVLSLAAGWLLPQLLGWAVAEDVGFQLNGLYMTFMWLGSSVCALSLCLPSMVKQLKGPLGELFKPYQQQPTSTRLFDILWFLPTLMVFALLSYTSTSSWQVGGIFLGVILCATVLLSMLSRLFSRGVGILPHHTSIPLSLRLARMWIKKNPFYWHASFLSLAGGIMLLTIIPLLQHSIEKNITRSQKTPDLFFLDIQPEQLSGLRNMLSEEGLLDGWVDSPFIIVELKTINNEPFKRIEHTDNEATEEQRSRGLTNRTMRVTYREQLSPSETVVAGKFYEGPWDPKQREYPEVSITDNFGKRIGMTLGDRLQFNIGGIEVSGDVTSVRKVDWLSIQPNFFIQFQPGVLEEAPKTHIGVLSTSDQTTSQIIQSRIIQAMPNISIVDVRRVVSVLEEIISRVSLALIAMAILSLFIGFAIFTFNIHYTVVSRLRNMALLVALGCPKRTTQRSLVMEYSLLAMCATLSGIAGAIAVSYVLNVTVFDNANPELIHLPYLVAISVMGVITATFTAWFICSRALHQPLWPRLNRPS